MRKNVLAVALIAGAAALSACSSDRDDADRAAMDAAAADAEANADADNSEMTSPVRNVEESKVSDNYTKAKREAEAKKKAAAD